MVYSTRRFVVCLTMCHFDLVFFSPFSIAITSLREERDNLSAFSTFVRFVLVWICRFPLPLGVWEGLRFVIVALPGLFSYLFLARALPMASQHWVWLGPRPPVLSTTSGRPTHPITIDMVKKAISQMKAGKKGKRKVQGVPQSQTAALPRPQE